MTRLVINTLFWLTVAVFAQPPITNLVLNTREVVMVPVAMDRLTVICFPSPVTQLEGAYLSTTTDPPARFQVVLRPGNSFFSVRSLLTNGTAAMHVHWKGKNYVFELVTSANPTLSLTLVEPTKHEPTAAGRFPSAHQLLGMLDTAKAYPVLSQQYTEELADVVYIRRKERYDYGTYEIRIEEVFRFCSRDTLVFRILVHNKAATPLRYLPQSLRVRVGDRTFYATISDGEGTVPPHGRVPVYFGVASAPDGSSHFLSPLNDFLVLVTVPDLGTALQSPSKSTR